MFDLINFKLKKGKQRKKRHSALWPVADRAESEESSLQICLEWTRSYDGWKESKLFTIAHFIFTYPKLKNFLQWASNFFNIKYLKWQQIQAVLSRKSNFYTRTVRIQIDLVCMEINVDDLLQTKIEMPYGSATILLVFIWKKKTYMSAEYKASALTWLFLH